jgi:thioesterase domain-containing protein
MIQRVNDEFGSHVSLRSFYEEPTIAGLAARLSRDGKPAIDRSRLFKVREKTNRATLFYFNGQPPGGGRYAHRFTSFLPADRGFFLVPLPLLNSPTTVEEIAAQRIDIIREAQPHGPYILGGNCFGATLSLEIARQLTEAGESVPLVALVHPDALATTHPLFRLTRRIALMAGVPEEFHTAEFKTAFNHTTRTLAAAWKAQRKMSWRERLDRFINAGRWTRQFVYGQRIPLRDVENDCMSQESELVTHRRHMEDAWIAYTLRPYAGKVAIIWPREGPSNPPWNGKALWKHYTPQFQWKDVPGNHWTMLHEYFEHSGRALGEFVSSVEA